MRRIPGKDATILDGWSAIRKLGRSLGLVNPRILENCRNEYPLEGMSLAEALSGASTTNIERPVPDAEMGNLKNEHFGAS